MEEVRAFLSQQSGSLLAEQVRRDWLKVLGKRQRWDLFRSEYPLLVGGDNEVSCYALQARWQQKDASALAEVRTHWYAPRELPTLACRWPKHSLPAASSPTGRCGSASAFCSKPE